MTTLITVAACSDDGGDDTTTPVTPSTLAGEWDITQVATNGELTPVIAGTNPTMTFGPEGVGVELGCNIGSASWHLAGNQLSIGPVMHTLKGCGKDANDQELAITRALEGADQAEIESDTLTIQDDTATTVLIATTA
jgi:heat shock protein HslJ